MSLEEGAHAIGLKDAYNLSGAQRLAVMELGDDEVPRKLLLKMAKAYKRSLLVFYLDAPPGKGDRGQDFRTIQGPSQNTPELDALIRDIRTRHDLIRSMVEDGENETVTFTGAATLETPPQELSARIAEHIHFSLADFQAQPDLDHAFQYLRLKIESSGVFVVLVGNLGTFHTNVPPEIFRGFAISDKIAPLIVINDQDARSARAFTALHELAHIWLGATGVSGPDADGRIEQYCNDAAGEMLLPATQLTGFKRITTGKLSDIAEEIAITAARCKVSRSMIAYRLYRVAMLDRESWLRLKGRFQQEWIDGKQAEKQKAGGGDYYLVRRHRLGTAVLNLVRRVLSEGNTTYTKAGHVLGVKPGHVDSLLYPAIRSTP